MLGKLIGCGGPALLVSFNAKGALRIGLGMMPRGEVVLILAGIGLAAGMLPPSLFGVAVMLPLVTALITPPLLNKALLLPGRGTRKESRGADTAAVAFEFPSPDIATLVTDTMAHQLQAEGFFVRTMDIEDKIAQVRKDDTGFSIKLRGPVLEAQGPVGDLPVAQTAVFEAEAPALGFGRGKPSRLSALSPFCVSLDLKGETKEEVVRELLGLLKEARKVDDIEAAFAAIMEREASMSTGMQDGVALPHAKIDGVEHLVAAVGLKPGGMDFASLDGKPTNIVVLSLSPKKNPESHLQYLAAVGKALRSEALRAKLLSAPNPGAVAELLNI
jgi:mannitol/fructose-specific phosphotransferase system IIA component (Ntr-type)